MTGATASGSKSHDSPNSTHSKSTKSALPRGSACVICRKRKLRCDGVRPSCSTCTRLKHTCAYGDLGHEKLSEQITELEAKVRLLEAELVQVRSGTHTPATPPVLTTLPYPPTSPLHPQFTTLVSPSPTHYDSFPPEQQIAPPDIELIAHPLELRTTIEPPHAALQKLQAHLQHRMYHNSGAFRPPDDAAADSDDASEGSEEDRLDEDHDIDMRHPLADVSEISTLTSGFELAGNAAYYAAPPAQFFTAQFAVAGESAVSPAGSGWASGESAFAGAEWSEGGERLSHSSGEEIDVSDSETHDDCRHCQSAPSTDLASVTDSPASHSLVGTGFDRRE